MDDDLTDFDEVTGDLVGDLPDDDHEHFPEFALHGTDPAKSRSIRQRIRRGWNILVHGHHKGASFRWRDRALVLLGGLVAALTAAAALSLILDLLGLTAGPLWTIQVQARQTILVGFTILGQTGMYALNHQLVTLVLGILGLGLLWRWQP